jgi:hypothetical protein
MTVQYFGMFSDAGNAVVNYLVKCSIINNLDWPEVYKNLCDLAKNPSYAEATDTVVREMVYDAVGCTGDFYV